MHDWCVALFAAALNEHDLSRTDPAQVFLLNPEFESAFRFHQHLMLLVVLMSRLLNKDKCPPRSSSLDGLQLCINKSADNLFKNCRSVL
jgi:hypothetical protein